MSDLPDNEVIVKIAKCSNCNCIVTACVKHLMTNQDIIEMGKEAIKYNHIISELPLLEYRKIENTFGCICNK
jgi:hypothetical protein